MISFSRSQKAASSSRLGGSPLTRMKRAWITSGRTARGGDVVQDLLEGDRRAIDELEVGLGAGFELGPDFAVVGVQDRQPALRRAAGGTCWRW